MGGEGGGHGVSRELDRTPTWAVALVCATIAILSILLEELLHMIGKWFQKRRKFALYEALEKIKGELMVLGFISLLLTFCQNYIADICIPVKVADTMLPCPRLEDRLRKSKQGDHSEQHRRLLWNEHRFLSGGGKGAACKMGFVPLISAHGLHQLHIFIFFLAVFHVIYSAVTMMLGKLKIRGWKEWERDSTRQNDPNRFRLTHETSFVRNHTNYWMQTAVTFYVICFFRQFVMSLRKYDYLTMRHGFMTVHLSPGSKFDFQKYIKRSLEDDFKVVVGISPVLWASMVIFMLLNVHGWSIVMHFFSVFPLIVILAVGTKLQGIIAQMAFEIKERHAVVQGIPLVSVSDSYFWFHRPQLVLHLIHFVLFQNAFEITYFLWIWYEFGLKSCFHDQFTLAIVRFFLGFAIQFLCSYSTLPLYALVTQMGSHMKKSIFDDQTSKALKQWHKKALHKKNDGKSSELSVKLGGNPSEISVESLETQALSSSTETANITATVDLSGDQNAQLTSKSSPAPADGQPSQQPPDLL